MSEKSEKSGKKIIASLVLVYKKQNDIKSYKIAKLKFVK